MFYNITRNISYFTVDFKLSKHTRTDEPTYHNFSTSLQINGSNRDYRVHCGMLSIMHHMLASVLLLVLKQTAAKVPLSRIIAQKSTRLTSDSACAMCEALAKASHLAQPAVE